MATCSVGHGLADPARQIAALDKGVRMNAMTHDDRIDKSARHFPRHAQI